MQANGFAAEMVEGARRSVVRVSREGRGAGAGVIFSRDGLALTSDHVVFGGRRGVRRSGRRAGETLVTLDDGRILDAEVARRSRDLDLALLRVGAGDLTAAPLGDSDSLRIGEMVFAIGHPWGLPGTVTAGIVSGIGGVRGPGGRSHVQSDVALAPGNSGGPLLNARGEVVGINAMVFGGLSLAVPSNVVSAWIARDAGTGRRPRLGVELAPALVDGARGGRSGFVVSAILPDGPAHRAGLLVGDVILGVGDEPAQSVRALVDALARFGAAGGADRVARLRVMRGGRVLVVDVDLGFSGPGRAA